jgi:formate C-acetyltransferase
MTDRIQRLLSHVRAKRHAALRRDVDWTPLTERFAREGVSSERRAGEAFARCSKRESPASCRRRRSVSRARSNRFLTSTRSSEMEETLRKSAYYHEKGCVFNISPNYGETIRVGLDARGSELAARRIRAIAEGDAEAVEFLSCAIRATDAVLDLADRYRREAERQGLTVIADTLARVPHQGATTFREALQALRILHYALWCEGEYHNGLGRVDQYLYPYFAADLAAGRLTEESALELIEEFFLACNRDSDLYIGVQQGDNGQSLMWAA